MWCCLRPGTNLVAPSAPAWCASGGRCFGSRHFKSSAQSAAHLSWTTGDSHLSDSSESPPRSQMTLPFLVSERGKKQRMDFKEEVLRGAAQLPTWSAGPGQCRYRPQATQVLADMVPQSFRSALPGISLHRKVPTPKDLREHVGDCFGA